MSQFWTTNSTISISMKRRMIIGGNSKVSHETPLQGFSSRWALAKSAAQAALPDDGVRL